MATRMPASKSDEPDTPESTEPHRGRAWGSWPRRLAGLARVAAVGVLAGTCTYGVDRLRAVLGQGVLRLRWSAALALWGGHVSLALAIVIAGALGLALASLLRARLGPRRADVVGPALPIWLAVALPALWVGRELTAGAWISEQWFAPLVRSAPLIFATLVLPICAHLAFVTAPVGRRSRVTSGAVGLAFAVLHVVDHRVAPGLHPEFHLYLQVLAMLTATTLFVRLVRALPQFPDRVGLVLAVAALVAAIAAPIQWIRMSRTARRELVLHAPMARLWLRHVMPSPTSTLLVDVLARLDATAGRYDAGVAEQERGLVDGKDFNVVFVVVDAMRADAIPPARPENGTPFVAPGETPVMDAWLEHTYRFSHAYTVSTKTHRAMPSLFRSSFITDDIAKMGVPLALRMAGLGRTTAAVVLDYFLSSKFKQITALVEGFEDMVFYEKNQADTTIPDALATLEALRDDRFFLWLHLYYVHDPGFDGKLLDETDCDRVECYHRSLGYLDSEFGKLLAGLETMGLAENTIVVLTADHGEGLYDHGLALHGPNVFEEDVRVPLAIAIPGHSGGIIDQPVGTIDVAPTLIDLVGGPLEPQDRGRSLVPLMAGAAELPERAYYFENFDSTVVGLVSGHDKLIYDTIIDVAMRYDLEADPDEQDDIFDADGERDRELLRMLVDFKPALVADELEGEAALALLSARLDEIDPKDPGAALPLLVRLVEQKPEKELLQRATDIFKQTRHRGVRLLLARHLHHVAPKTYTKLLWGWIDSFAGKRGELEIVSGLAAQGQQAFAQKQIAERLEHWATKGQPKDWPPYLRLVRPWRLGMNQVGEPLAIMLERTAERPETVPDAVLQLILENVSELKVVGSTQRLVTAIRPLLEHSEPRIQGQAARALGKMRSKEDLPVLRRRLLDPNEDPRVRRDCAAALASILGDAAVPELIALAQAEPAMTRLVFRQIDRMDSAAALPWLQDLSENHYNSYIRNGARRAIFRIEARRNPPPEPTIETETE